MVCGIVCEYNPFHLGHEKQIQYLKNQGHQVVCIMSGSFVQRGEAAVYDKWQRAKWALAAGADLVLELPVFYSLQSAQGFARGAIASLHASGLVDAVSFGIEVNDIDVLRSLADLQASDRFNDALKTHLANGLSYPRAMEQAAKDLLPDLPNEAFYPNSLLGVEYLKAMAELNWSPALLPLYRGSNSPTASGCRSRIRLGEKLGGVPSYVAEDADSLSPVFLNSLEQLILHRLRSISPEELNKIEDVSEGLENRLIKSAKECTSLDALIDAVGSRYTRARIKRILCCALIGITKAELAPYRLRAPYLRVLGMNAKAKHLLSQLSNCGIPIITGAKEHDTHPMFRLDLRATELYALANNTPYGADYTRGLIIQA